MLRNTLQKTFIKTVIVALSIFIGTSPCAFAGCGWSTKKVCHSEAVTDTHGATIDNHSAPYNLTKNSYTIMWILPAWICQGSNVPSWCFTPDTCYVYEEVYTWQPDPNDGCCNNPDTKCGKDPCKDSTDLCCGKEDDPCCPSPLNCTCQNKNN